MFDIIFLNYWTIILLSFDSCVILTIYTYFVNCNKIKKLTSNSLKKTSNPHVIKTDFNHKEYIFDSVFSQSVDLTTQLQP